MPPGGAASTEPAGGATGPDGRVYLDVAWEDIGLVVEIDGGHHALALNPVDDALRQNEVTLGDDMVLRESRSSGCGSTPAAFMARSSGHAGPCGPGHRGLVARPVLQGAR